MISVEFRPWFILAGLTLGVTVTLHLRTTAHRPPPLQAARRFLMGLSYQQLWWAQKDACFNVEEKNIAISKTRGLIKRETIARFWIELKFLC